MLRSNGIVADRFYGPLLLKPPPRVKATIRRGDGHRGQNDSS